MCGISMFFARESIPDITLLDILFKWGEKRGNDGFGLCHITPNGSKLVYKTDETYSKHNYNVKDFLLSNGLGVGDIIIAISRAQPETEAPTTLDNIQPIINNNIVLVHNGAVCNYISNKLKEKCKTTDQYKFETFIDSEAIIASYILHGRNIKNALEYISGGVACILLDMGKKKIYLATDFKPIAHCYIRGIGYFVASDNDCLREIVQKITGAPRDGMNVWEDWYAHYIRGNSIKEIDIDSGMTRSIKYKPRYITQDWDTKNKSSGDLCIVACSGGLDSSITLSILKLAGYENILACHFKYGHRGQEAEESAINKICKQLDIKLKTIDIKSAMKQIDNKSMLIDPTKEITTGTDKGLKKLDAWVNGRNMLFLSFMAAIAEREVMDNNFSKVYLLGGMLNLSESGSYPDNSEYFLSSFLEHCKYGTLIGDRIEPLYCLSNLMKSELFSLIKCFHLEDIYKNTISCDRPYYDKDNDIAYNCSKDGIPACGSGLLSYWASQMVGMKDDRNFYEVDDEQYEAYIPIHIKEKFNRKYINVESIINRILLPKSKIEELKNNL